MATDPRVMVTTIATDYRSPVSSEGSITRHKFPKSWTELPTRLRWAKFVLLAPIITGMVGGMEMHCGREPLRQSISIPFAKETRERRTPQAVADGGRIGHRAKVSSRVIQAAQCLSLRTALFNSFRKRLTIETINVWEVAVTVSPWIRSSLVNLRPNKPRSTWLVFCFILGQPSCYAVGFRPRTLLVIQVCPVHKRLRSIV